jgi:hypothetical protein
MSETLLAGCVASGATIAELGSLLLNSVMIFSALDAVIEATRAGRVVWRKVEPDRYETATEPKVSIEFHYPQVGGETTTGADIAVVSLGGGMYSFFSGSEGMTKVQTILRSAFPDWHEHLARLENNIDEFIENIRKA